MTRPTFSEHCSDHGELDRYTYTYGAAELSTDENSDGDIMGATLTLPERVLHFDGSEMQTLRDLASLFHHHSVQNAIDMRGREADGPPQFTMARALHDKRLDSAPVHEVERDVCQAMERMGLSDDQQHDLFGHIAELAHQATTAHWRSGFEDGRESIMKGIRQALKEQEAKEQ